MRKTIKIDGTVIVLDKIVAVEAEERIDDIEVVVIRTVGGGKDIRLVVDDAESAANTITDAIEGRLPDYWDGVIE